MSSNPFGITQVDIPGLLGLHQKMKHQRLDDLYLKQKMDREEKKAEREDAIANAYRGAVRRNRGLPAQDASVSVNLGTLSQVRDLATLSGSRGDAGQVVTNAPDTPEPSLSPSSTSSPEASVIPVMPELPNAPSHLLAGSEPSDDGVDFSPGLSLDPEGLDKLADLDPKGAYDLQKMDDEARARAFKRITEHADFVSRVIGAVRSAPEAQRAAHYEQIRKDLEAKGVQGLPPRWNEEQADSLQRMGLTAVQAFQDARADRRLEQDIADDEEDNARADRNTDSLIEDRSARRGLVARGQNMADARGRRGQDIASSDRRRGQDMTDTRLREGGGRRGKSDKQAVVDVQTPDQARQLKPGTMFRTPDGKVKVR